MTRAFAWLALLLGTGGGLVRADVLAVTLHPLEIAGYPGTRVGWGFRMISGLDTEWISITGSAPVFESNPLLGTYTDFVGPQGGPIDFALPPHTIWSEAFDAPALLGMGAFDIDPTQPAGAEDRGFVRVLYDVFDGDPLVGGAYLSSGSVDTPFVVVAVPEPLSVLLLLTCLAAAPAMGRRLSR